MLGRFWSKSRNREIDDFDTIFQNRNREKNRYLKKWKKSKSNLRIAKIKKPSNRTNCGHIFDSTKTFWNFVAISHWLMAFFYNFWPEFGNFENFCLYFSFISKTLSYRNTLKSAYFRVARIEESIEIEKRYFGEIDQSQNRQSLVSKNRNWKIL